MWSGVQMYVFFSEDNTIRYSFNTYIFLVMVMSTNLEATWTLRSTPGNGGNVMRAGYPEGASLVIASLLRWCYRWQLCEGQQKPSADTHLLHMSILPLNPSKGFPESSSLSSGPQLFEVLILSVWSHYPMAMLCQTSDSNVWSAKGSA